MSLYGDRYIRNDSLKRWINTLNSNIPNYFDLGGNKIETDDYFKDIIRAQFNIFKKGIQNLKPSDDWRMLQNHLSEAFFNMFFRVDNGAIRIANYFERFIIPSNIKNI